MPDEMISRERANTVRLVSQSAAAVFVVGAAFLAVFGSPFGGGLNVREVGYDEVQSQAAEMARASSSPADADEGPAMLPPDMEAIEYSLLQVKNAPQPKVTEPTDTGAPVDPKPSEPIAEEGRTRFLGTIRIGERYMALLSAGGSQRIMGSGDTRVLPLMPGDQGDPPEVEVHEVTESYVRLSENGVERTVDKAQRVGIAVSQSAPPADVGPRTAADAAGDRAALARIGSGGGEDVADKPINPDDYRREDGTIDYEALRAAARERARARQDRFRGEEEDEGRDRD